MPSVLEDIFLVPFRDNFVLHAPLHGVTGFVNPTVAAELRAGLASGDLTGLSPQARPLGESLRRANPIRPGERTGPFSPAYVSLLPTNDCNMRCLYCAPGAGSLDCSYMSPEVCEAALRFQAAVVRRDERKHLMVYYFGGEPFVAWKLVQFADVLGRELAAELGVPFRSACTTNAFMSETHARWVAQHLSFALVSMDGPADMHDFYRPTRSGKGTHEVVARNVRIFRDKGLPFALRCSVDEHTVKRLPEVVEYFCREFQPTKINLEPLIEHGRCLETGLRSPAPAEFVSGVVAAGRVARLWGVELKLTTAQTERLAQSNCMVAEDNFVVAPDGLVSACYGANHRGSLQAPDYAIGEVDVAEKAVRIDPAKLARVRSYGVANIPRCRRCFAKWHCSGGCRLFHTPPSCNAPPNQLCRVTQTLTLWRILMQLRLFEEADRVRLNGDLHESS
ncbi:MAG TPA: radical SAM protein [Verrucomicrobiae bacterium]|nr:radical SAM protein [Verrucomicrobiae bacterium]